MRTGGLQSLQFVHHGHYLERMGLARGSVQILSPASKLVLCANVIMFMCNML